ncbi:class I SAM-dependent methyltransferase [Marinoscillum sp.]|uniref:class I SAM-dependent methyltransferase n=1 Tax=Marinoscillum sp. TaxID=2024838 RepID=UPI003BAB596F
MNANFDKAAATYDRDFTNSAIGRLQRHAVWKQLEGELKSGETLRILEINCGTGEDALRMSSLGHKVIATDISEEMLSVARYKSKNLRISFLTLDIHDLGTYPLEGHFDLIFSNFGGLNCISPEALGDFGRNAQSLLVPGGQLIAVLMPEFCLWETSYFCMKGKVKSAFRRSRRYAVANVNGSRVPTWYYSPGRFRNLLNVYFTGGKVRPVGFFVPPSYLGSFFLRYPRSLRFLGKMDSLLFRCSWLSGASDHYYLQLFAK